MPSMETMISGHLGKYPAMDQARSFIGIRQVIGNDTIMQLLDTDPVNVLDNADQFDIRSLQNLLQSVQFMVAFSNQTLLIPGKFP